MKKTLLLAAAAVAAFSVQAASLSDYLTVSVGENEVAEGDVVNVEEYEDFESIVPGMGYQFDAHIVLTNKTSKDVKNNLVVAYTDHPTQAMAETDKSAWGGLQICYGGAVEGNQCLSDLNVSMTVPANGSAYYDFENTTVSPTTDKKNRKYQLTITAEGQSLTFFVMFQPDGDSQVADIIASDSEAEFFNLQGQRVANPGKGLYLVKKAGKTSKVMLR